VHISTSILFGLLAGILSVTSTVPYVIDIFRHKTKPERAMWWIYSVLFTLLFVAQLSAGAHWLLIVTAEYVLASLLIAVLSVPYGFGSFHKRDTVSLAIAAAGLLAWLLTNRPIIAILMVVIVDFAGFWLTLVKTWHAPHSETLIAWQLSCVAAVLSVFAAGTWNFTIIVYPVYAVLGSGLLVWLIMYRRTKVREDPKDF